MPTTTPISEAWHNGGFIVSEARGHQSRESVTIASGQSLQAGTVLGAVTTGTATSAAGTNTGNGVMGAITVGSGAMAGVYTLRITKVVTNAGDFSVIDPTGEVCGTGSVAAAFSAGGLSFTLADGATDFVVGDTFAITVSAVSDSYSPYDPTATNGLQKARAILWGATDATAAARKGAVIARQAEVNGNELVWGANVTTTAHKIIALSALGRLGIIAR